MTKVRRTIIPVARFVPETKAFPKQMLPVVDNLTDQYIVNEVTQSSVKDIIIATREDNDAIQEAPKLDRNLFKEIKFGIFNKKILSQVEVHYSYQKDPKIIRHTIGYTCKFIVNNFYAELLKAEILRITQLLNDYEAILPSVSMGQAVNHHGVHYYGITNSSSRSGHSCKVDKIIQKLVSNTKIFNLVTMSCHMFKVKIMNFTGGKEVESGGEIRLTHTMQKLNETQHILAYVSQEEHYETGEKLECIKNKGLRQLMLGYLTQILKKESAWAK
ncbi:hypothetical protein LRO89_04730 [Priestia megaterium]|uniref:hypothetical protein n=1 Tax=Priestia megaterium TaxID=1404 RepID=UPI0039C03A0A